MRATKFRLGTAGIAVLALVIALAARGARAESLLAVFDVPTPGQNQHFGSAVAMGDSDGDGVADVAVTSILPYSDRHGTVYLYSGSTGALMRTYVSPNPEPCGPYHCPNFGFALAMIDADLDGRADLVVSAPGEHSGDDETGRIYIFSGATGNVIRTFDLNGVDLDVGDANGDGHDDLVTSGYAVGVGPDVTIFDGPTGNFIRTFISPNPQLGDNFALQLAVGDANGDGKIDVLVAASWEDTAPDIGHENVGRAYLFDGANGNLIRTFDSPNASYHGFFSASVAMGDVDGDGLADAIVGAPYEQHGRVYIFSGGTGALLYTLTDPHPQSPNGLYFGIGLFAADLDGNGFDDLITLNATAVGPERELLFSFDQAGVSSRTLDSNHLGFDNWASAFAVYQGVGGITQLAVGSPLEPVNGAFGQGRAYVLAFPNETAPVGGSVELRMTQDSAGPFKPVAVLALAIFIALSLVAWRPNRRPR